MKSERDRKRGECDTASLHSSSVSVEISRRRGVRFTLRLALALFLDLAGRTGQSGIQEWMSFYFKSPQAAPDLYPENDLFIQLIKLKNTLRHMKGEELITHLGNEYYA